MNEEEDDQDEEEEEEEKGIGTTLMKSRSITVNVLQCRFEAINIF